MTYNIASLFTLKRLAIARSKMTKGKEDLTVTILDVAQRCGCLLFLKNHCQGRSVRL